MSGIPKIKNEETNVLKFEHKCMIFSMNSQYNMTAKKIPVIFKTSTCCIENHWNTNTLESNFKFFFYKLYVQNQIY